MVEQCKKIMMISEAIAGYYHNSEKIEMTRNVDESYCGGEYNTDLLCKINAHEKCLPYQALAKPA